MDSRDDCGYFLSCWSVRNIDLSTQLIKSPFTWGLQLPPDYIPRCVDILASPSMTTDVDDTSLVAKRLATVLINDSSTTTNYRVFQLRLQANTASTADLNVNIVSARCTAFGSIGSSAELFIASSSVAKARDDGDNGDEYTVIDTKRNCGVGLDAILVSNSTTHCVALRIASTSTLSNEPSRGDIAQYWLADIVDGNGVATGGTYKTLKFLEWIFQLVHGRLANSFSILHQSIGCPFSRV